MDKTLDYYNKNACQFVQGTLSVDFKQTQDRFLVKLPVGAYILDFGCGSGRDTKYFMDMGYVVDASDGSEELCKIASDYTGIDVKCMLFEELAEVQRYDGIWACSSILHLSKDILADVLKKMAIAEHNSELKAYKEQLTNMVPYRALAGFFNKSSEAADWGSVRRMTAYIERINRDTVLLPYTLGVESKLKKKVYFQDAWVEMIQDQTVAILGWIQYEKVKWLQNNNPEVPGLIYKLAPMDERMRKLNNVRKLWEGILDVSEIRDVFTDGSVVSKQYDVDHFIPWSFVMNDELWNLMPMDSSLNSSKRNRLPKWDPFFIRFAKNQFIMYQLIHEKEGIRKLYESCYRDNLHSIWAGQELYRKGNSEEKFMNILQKNMQPIYDSARRQGYEVWNRG